MVRTEGLKAINHDISTEKPCSLIISTGRAIQRPGLLCFPSASLTLNFLKESWTGPNLGSFQTFIPAFLLRCFSDFCKVLVKILQLRVVGLHHLLNSVTDILWCFRILVFRFLINGSACIPRFPETGFVRFPRLWRAPHSHFSALLPEVHGPLVFFFYFFTKVHHFFLILLLSFTSFLGVIRQASHHFEYLSFSLALSLQCLAQVFFFCHDHIQFLHFVGEFFPLTSELRAFPLVFRTLCDFFHW